LTARPSAPDARSGSAEWAIAGTMLALPLVAVFAANALTPLVVLVAVLALADGRVRRGAAAAFPRTVALALAALLLWALASLAWADDDWARFDLWLQIAGLNLAGMVGLVAARGLDAGGRRRVETAMIVAAIGFTVLFAIELAAGGWLSRSAVALWNAATPWTSAPPTSGNLLGRGSAILAGFAWPAAVAVRRRLGWGAVGAFLGAVGVLMWLQPMLAAFVAFVCAALVAAITLRWPRLALVLLALGLVTANIGVVRLSETVVARYEAGTPVPDLPGSWRERFHILAFAVDKIGERPLLGWGFDASRRVGQDVVGPFDGNRAIPLHPHNGWAQLWLELGVVGAILGLALVGLVLLAAARVRAGDRLVTAAALGACVAYLVVGNISYGVWQSWWIANAWLTALAIGAIGTKPFSDRGQK